MLLEYNHNMVVVGEKWPRSSRWIDLVVLKEDALALGRDTLRDIVEVVGLTGHGAGGSVADTVSRARQREVQAAQHQQ